MEIMIDIETLAVTPDALVLSIGAVEFSVQGGVGDTFYAVLGMDEQATRRIDPGTLQWWMRQGPDAQEVLLAPSESVAAGLARLTAFVVRHASLNDGVWANGPDFDLVILQSLYRDYHMRTPWTHKQHRCYRTLRALAPTVSIADNMVLHNALSDAKWQAQYAIKALIAMGATP